MQRYEWAVGVARLARAEEHLTALDQEGYEVCHIATIALPPSPEDPGVRLVIVARRPKAKP